MRPQRIGNLRGRLTFYRREDGTDERGQPSGDWKRFCKVPAARLDPQTSVESQAEQRIETERATFEIRYRNDIEAGQRFTDQRSGQSFTVANAIDPDWRRRRLHVTGEAVNWPVQEF